MKCIWIHTIALLTAISGFADDPNDVLTEKSIRQLIEQRDILIRQYRQEEAIKLYTTNAIYASEFASMPGSYKESSPQDFLKGIADTKEGVLSYATTPLTIEISDDGRTALVENKVRVTCLPEPSRRRTMTWHVEEFLELSIFASSPKIDFNDFYIAGQSLEPDKLSKRIMSLSQQVEAPDKEAAFELLKASGCQYMEGTGEPGGIQITIPYASLSCGDEIPALAARIPNVKELIIFGGATITDEGLEHIGKMKQLENLMLFSEEITDEGIAEITACKNLEALLLDGIQLTSASLEYIATLPKLKTLNISCFEIASTDLAHLSKSKTLSDLDLNCDLSDDDLAMLAGIPNLTKLFISGDSLSNAGLNHVAKMVNLDYIDIYAPDITVAGVKKLKEAKPNLIVRPASLVEPPE